MNKSVMALVECLSISEEDAMESSLWRETFTRSLGSHDAVELLGGIYHVVSGCQ